VPPTEARQNAGPGHSTEGYSWVVFEAIETDGDHDLPSKVRALPAPSTSAQEVAEAHAMVLKRTLPVPPALTEAVASATAWSTVTLSVAQLVPSNRYTKPYVSSAAAQDVALGHDIESMLTPPCLPPSW
jgi:hypothetical protein